MGSSATSEKGIYPDQMLFDLVDRDQLKNTKVDEVVHVTSSIHTLYGYNQSFVSCFFTNVMLNKQEFWVYNFGCYLVMLQNSSPIQQHLLPHDDNIISAQLSKKICLTGCSGGKVILWDLELKEKKISIRLPQHKSPSSLGLLPKFIIASDTS